MARVEEIFTAALSLPEAERAALVAAQCGADAALQAEVLRLLEAQAGAGDFLSTSLLDFRGQQFGAYRATEELGRGGMSVVYRGERTDSGFDKRVAIKVILAQSASAPETQILASLEHPNVARLLDAGVTELGFRYLLMEQVDSGTPVTAFASALNETQKLRLFLQICAGVQAAHQSLIVHRDLKPDNILVTPDGQVKLLDFGIAKMLAPTGVQTTGARAYTVDYASPEQILGYPASTANDVYSLGVVLYEMLTGQLPRTLSGLPLEDVVLRVRDEEPTAAALAGDLGVIAAKALRREPAERYESAGAMARDVDRYLAGEPIEARPPTWRYLAGRFVSRHRYAVASAVLAAGTLAGVAAYALRQAQLAEQRFGQVRALSRSVMFELHDAVEPLQGSLPARQMIVDRSLQYLDALARDTGASDEVRLDAARGYLRLAEIQGDDNDRASVGQSAKAPARLREAVALARQVHERQPGHRGAQLTLIEALRASASAQLVLGREEAAFASAREAVSLAERLLAEPPGGPDVKSSAARALVTLGQAHAEASQWKESLAYYERGVALHKAVADAHPGQLPARAEWLRAVSFYAGNLYRAGNRAELARQMEAARPVSIELYQSDPRRYRALRAAIVGLETTLVSKQGDRVVAIYTEQLRLRREMEADNPQDAVTASRVASTLDRIGLAYQRMKRYPEAVRFGEESLAKIREVRKLDPASTSHATEFFFSLMDLATAYKMTGRGGQACKLAHEAVALLDGDAIRKSELAYSKTAEPIRKLAAACSAGKL